MARVSAPSTHRTTRSQANKEPLVKLETPPKKTRPSKQPAPKKEPNRPQKPNPKQQQQKKKQPQRQKSKPAQDAEPESPGEETDSSRENSQPTLAPSHLSPASTQLVTEAARNTQTSPSSSHLPVSSDSQLLINKGQGQEPAPIVSRQETPGAVKTQCSASPSLPVNAHGESGTAQSLLAPAQETPAVVQALPEVPGVPSSASNDLENAPTVESSSAFSIAEPEAIAAPSIVTPFVPQRSAIHVLYSQQPASTAPATHDVAVQTVASVNSLAGPGFAAQTCSTAAAPATRDFAVQTSPVLAPITCSSAVQSSATATHDVAVQTSGPATRDTAVQCLATATHDVAVQTSGPATRDVATQTSLRLPGQELLPLTQEEIQLVRSHRLKKHVASATPSSLRRRFRSPAPNDSAMADQSDSARVQATEAASENIDLLGPLPKFRKRGRPIHTQETDEHEIRRTRRRLNHQRNDTPVSKKVSGRSDSAQGRAKSQSTHRRRSRSESSRSSASDSSANETSANTPSASMPTTHSGTVVKAMDKVRPLLSAIGAVKAVDYDSEDESRPVARHFVQHKPHQGPWRKNYVPGVHKAPRKVVESSLPESQVVAAPIVGAFPISPEPALNETTLEPNIFLPQTPSGNGWGFNTLSSSLSRVFQFNGGDRTPSRDAYTSTSAPTPQAPQTAPHQRPQAALPLVPATVTTTRAYHGNWKEPEDTFEPGQHRPILHGSKEHRQLRALKIRQKKEDDAKKELVKKAAFEAAQKATVTKKRKRMWEKRVKHLHPTATFKTFNWDGYFAFPDTSSSESSESDDSEGASAQGSPSMGQGDRAAKRAKVSDLYDSDGYRMHPVFHGRQSLRGRPTLNQESVDRDTVQQLINTGRLGKGKSPLSNKNTSPAAALKAKKTKIITVTRGYKTPGPGRYGMVYDSSSSEEDIEVTDNESNGGDSPQASSPAGTAANASESSAAHNLFVQASQQNPGVSPPTIIAQSAPLTQQSSNNFRASEDTSKLSASGANNLIEPSNESSSVSGEWTQTPPPRPSPAHAELPSGSPQSSPGQLESLKATDEEGTFASTSDPLSRARSQAEKYKPKTPSGLRASSRLSNTSTVYSEAAEDSRSLGLSSDNTVWGPESSAAGLAEPKARDSASQQTVTAAERAALDLDLDLEVELALAVMPEEELHDQFEWPDVRETNPADFGIDPIVWQAAVDSFPAQGDAEYQKFEEEFEDWKAQKSAEGVVV
ncbi:MAG: ATP-dependent rRNA helicase spb4 [Chaenotheca gracillima]|nr:MAG: ATP-dependent rRNA helicase spb4 [Chaenotheca gracillima]